MRSEIEVMYPEDASDVAVVCSFAYYESVLEGVRGQASPLPIRTSATRK